MTILKALEPSRFPAAENNLLCHPSWDILFFSIQKTSARGNSESKNTRETIGFKDFYPKISIFLSVTSMEKKKKREERKGQHNVYKTGGRERNEVVPGVIQRKRSNSLTSPPGTQHKHISAHTPSKALAE